MRTYKIYNPSTSSSRYALTDAPSDICLAWISFVGNCKANYKVPTSWWGRYKDLPLYVLREKLVDYNATLSKWDSKSGYMTLTFEDEGFTAFLLTWAR